MSKILEMRQKRAEVWDKARAFLDEHTNENGVMSAEDSQQYERMEQEVVDLGHTIERMERAEQMDREMNEPVRQPLASRPEKNPGGRTGRASDEYKLAFWNMIRNRGEHFQVRNALQIGTDSEGGFLCPDEYEHTLVQALTEEKLDVIEVLDRRALFSNGRLMPEQIPEGLYAYDLRHSDDGDRFCAIEPKVGVNHGGTVLMRDILDFGESGYIPLDEDTEPNFPGETMTASEFAEEEIQDESMQMGGM